MISIFLYSLLSSTASVSLGSTDFNFLESNTASFHLIAQVDAGETHDYIDWEGGGGVYMSFGLHGALARTGIDLLLGSINNFQNIPSAFFLSNSNMEQVSVPLEIGYPFYSQSSMKYLYIGAEPSIFFNPHQNVFENIAVLGIDVFGKHKNNDGSTDGKTFGIELYSNTFGRFKVVGIQFVLGIWAGLTHE